MQDLQASLAVALEPRFRNIAGQIMPHAARCAHFRQQPNNCDYFSQLGADHAGVCNVAGAMGGQPGRFTSQAAVTTRASLSGPTYQGVQAHTHPPTTCGQKAVGRRGHAWTPLTASHNTAYHSECCMPGELRVSAPDCSAMQTQAFATCAPV